MDNSDFEREFPYVPEIAQNPHALVGKRIVVGGLGKGLVLEFNKVFSILMPDSSHTIDFKSDIGIRKVLLRRKKNLKFNSGLYFRVMSDEEARAEKESEGKAEVDALRFQLHAVESALRSTMDRHESEITKIQEEHELEIRETEVRVSTQIARRMSFSGGGVNMEDFNFPSPVLEENEYDFQEDDEEENAKLAELLKNVKESAEKAEMAEFREAQANDKVNELEKKIALWKSKLDQQEQNVGSNQEGQTEVAVSVGTSDNTEGSAVATEEVVTDDAKQTEAEMRDVVQQLERQLLEAREKAAVEAEYRKVAEAEAAKLRKMAPKGRTSSQSVASPVTHKVSAQAVGLVVNGAVEAVSQAMSLNVNAAGAIISAVSESLSRTMCQSGEDSDDDVFIDTYKTGDADSMSTEVMLRKERTELQAAARRQQEELARLETLANNGDNLVQKHEAAVGKMEAMAMQLASVEAELLKSIAEKQKLAEELNAKAEASFVQIDAVEDEDLAAASAALAEAENASLRQEAEALKREVVELQAAASAASAASTALRSQLANDQQSLSLRKIGSTNKLNQTKSPTLDSAVDVAKQNLTSQFEENHTEQEVNPLTDENVNPLLFGVDLQEDDSSSATTDSSSKKEDDVTAQLSRENEMLRQQLRELEERNQALMIDTEAVTSVVEYASDYERMIAATEKFHREVVNMRGFSSARGMSLFRGDSQGRSQSRMSMRSDMSSNYDDYDVDLYQEPDSADVEDFARLSIAASQFSMGDMAEMGSPVHGEDGDRIRSFPFAMDSPDGVVSPSKRYPTSDARSALDRSGDDEDDDDERDVVHNIPLHDDDDDRHGPSQRGGNIHDIREQSLARVAALNKDATALVQEKKLVSEAEDELNAAMREMADKVDRGERSPDDEVDQHVSGLAAKLSVRRKSYHASELKLQKDVQELKKTVSAIDLRKGDKDSNAPLTPLRRASLKFMQEIQPLRSGSMSRPSPRHMSSAPSPRTLPPNSGIGKVTPNSASANNMAAAAAAAAAEVAAEDALTDM